MRRSYYCIILCESNNVLGSMAKSPRAFEPPTNQWLIRACGSGSGRKSAARLHPWHGLPDYFLRFRVPDLELRTPQIIEASQPMAVHIGDV